MACCVLQLFVKAGAGSNGVGRPSGGVILDKVLPCAMSMLGAIIHWHVRSTILCTLFWTPCISAAEQLPQIALQYFDL